MNVGDPSTNGEDDAIPDSEVGNPRSEVLTPTAGDVPVTSADGLASPRHDSGKSNHTRRWAIGLLAAVIVIVGAVVGIIVVSSSSAGITTGTGTATIHWTSVKDDSDHFGNPPQPFAGTIDGLWVSGVATNPLTASDGSRITSPADLSKVLFFRWSGTFGGKPFTVNIYADYLHGTPLSAQAPLHPTVTVGGTWGSDRVKGTVATPSAAELKKGNGPIHFAGTVGDMKVSGVVSHPTGNRGHQTSTATFTVSK